MSNLFIVLEGIDGVGKTSCAKLLAERMGGYYLSTPPSPFDAMRSAIDELCDVTTRFHFFLTAIIASSALAKCVLRKQSVICDRYIYTTLAYHRTLGVNMDCLKVEALPILWPSHTFFLHASETTRKSRLNCRGATQWDRLFTNNGKLRERLLAEFQQFALPIIDTTNMSIDSVVESIVSTVYKPEAIQKVQPR